MLPQSLILEYWKDVEDILVSRHRLSRSQASEGIIAFLKLAEQHQFVEAVYHRDADDTAATIAGGLSDKGYLRRSSKQKKPAKTSLATA